MASSTVTSATIPRTTTTATVTMNLPTLTTATITPTTSCNEDPLLISLHPSFTDDPLSILNTPPSGFLATNSSNNSSLEPSSYSSSVFDDSFNALEILAEAATMSTPESQAAMEHPIPLADVPSLLQALGNGNFILDQNDTPEDLGWSWDSEVTSMFAIPDPTPGKKKNTSSITSHRLLTSNEVIQNKRQKIKVKEEKELEKEERKRKRD